MKLILLQGGYNIINSSIREFNYEVHFVETRPEHFVWVYPIDSTVAVAHQGI